MSDKTLAQREESVTLPLGKADRKLSTLASEVFTNFQIRSAWGALPSGFERSFVAEAIRFLNEALVPLCRESLYTEDIVADVRVKEVIWKNGRELFTMEFGGLVDGRTLIFRELQTPSDPSSDIKNMPCLRVGLDDGQSLDFIVEILTYEATGLEEALEPRQVDQLKATVKGLYRACTREPGVTARRELFRPSDQIPGKRGALRREKRTRREDLEHLIRSANSSVVHLLQELNHPDQGELYRSHIMLLHPKVGQRPSYLYYLTYDTSVPPSCELFFARKSDNPVLRRLEAQGRSLPYDRLESLAEKARDLANEVLRLADAFVNSELSPALGVGGVLSRLCALYAEVTQRRNGAEEELELPHNTVVSLWYADVGKILCGDQARDSTEVREGVTEHLRTVEFNLETIWGRLVSLLELCPGVEKDVEFPDASQIWWECAWSLLYNLGFGKADVTTLGRVASKEDKNPPTGRRSYFQELFEIVWGGDEEITRKASEAYQVDCNELLDGAGSFFQPCYSEFLWTRVDGFKDRMRTACIEWYEEGLETRRSLGEHLLTSGSVAEPDCWDWDQARERSLLFQEESAGSAGRIRSAYVPLLISNQKRESSFKMNNRLEETRPEYLVMGLIERPQGVGGTANPLLIAPLISNGHIVGVNFVTFFGFNGGFFERNLRDIEAHSLGVASAIQEHRERFFSEGQLREAGWIETLRNEFLKKAVRAIGVLYSATPCILRVKYHEHLGGWTESGDPVISSWGEELPGEFNHRDTVANKAVKELFADAELGEDWTICVTPLEGDGSLLSVWNPLEMNDPDRQRIELISLHCEQSADVLDESLPQISRFLYKAFNPEGVTPPVGGGIREFAEEFTEEAKRKVNPQFDERWVGGLEERAAQYAREAGLSAARALLQKLRELKKSDASMKRITDMIADARGL